MFLWYILNFFTLTIFRPFTGGWVLLSWDDQRFLQARSLCVNGQPAEKDRGILSRRSAWKTYVIFEVQGGEGMLVCLDCKNNLLACWRGWTPWKPRLFQPGDQVALRVGEHDADWRLFYPKGCPPRTSPSLKVLGRCHERELFKKFPKAVKY